MNITERVAYLKGLAEGMELNTEKGEGKLLSAVIGAIIYYVVITLVLRLGLESTDLKLLTALVVALFLSIPYWKGRYFTKSAKKGGALRA